MATLSSRNTRLENEYNALRKVPINSLYRWAVTQGQTPPAVKSYTVTYTNPDPVHTSSGVRTRNRITIRFDLPDDYPNSCPIATIVEGDIPYLTNVFSSGSFCFGNLYDPNAWLWEWFITVGRILAGDPSLQYTNPNSAANRDAATYFLNNRSKFPFGRTDFPRPPGF